jgi:ATP/ADP translocase
MECGGDIVFIFFRITFNCTFCYNIQDSPMVARLRNQKIFVCHTYLLTTRTAAVAPYQPAYHNLKY